MHKHEEQLTVEQKAQKYDEWVSQDNLTETKELLGCIGCHYTEHSCMGTVQTGGIPVHTDTGLTSGTTKYKEIEQKQYNMILMLTPCFGDSGNVMLYFNNGKFVTKRVYANNAK